MGSAPNIRFAMEDVYDRARQTPWLEFKGGNFPIPLMLRFGKVDNELVCTGLMLGLADSDIRPITASDLRLPLATIVSFVRAVARKEQELAREKKSTGYLRLFGIAVDRLSPSTVPAIPRARPGRRGYPDEHWREVADRYRRALEADKRRPTKLLVEHYERESISEATVRWWLREARKRGFLGKAPIGRAGDTRAKPRGDKKR